VDRETRERRDRLLEGVTYRFDARPELAELYRCLGHVDQAGRWGISVEGWTRSRERDAYAALIKQRRPDAEGMLRRLSAIGPREPLTGDARSVIAGAHAGSAESVRALSGWREQVDFASRLTSVFVAAGGGIVVALMVVMIFGAAFVGHDDLKVPARLATTLGALTFGLAVSFRVSSAVLRKHWVRAGLLATVALALAVAFWLLATSPGLALPGEV
jgi:hypothetical protein